MSKNILRKLGAVKIKVCPNCIEGLKNREMYCWRLWHPITIMIIIISFPFAILAVGIPSAILNIIEIGNSWYDWE